MPRALIYNECLHRAFILEEEAALLWNRLEAGANREELQLMADSIGVGESLADFIGQLEADGLVTGVEPAANDGASRPTPEPPPKPMAFEESTADAHLREFMEWATDHGFLYSIHWEITWRCNERCVHCYNPGAAHLPHEKAERDTNELDTGEVFAALGQMRDLGVFRLTLSGGEPMLRRDFWEIMAEARRLGFSVNIYTNGLKLNSESVQRLAQLYPSTVSISVYSAEPTVHDQITRIPGSFGRSVEALALLRQHGIRTYLKSIQMNHTVRSHSLVHELAETLGAGPEIDMGMSAAADGASAPLALAAQNPAELVVMAATPGSPLYVGSVEEGFHYIQRDPHATVCGAGVGAMSIDPEGTILPCSSLPIPCGTLRDDGLEKVWNNSRVHRRGQARSQVSAPGSLDTGDVLSRWQQITLKDYHECGAHDRCLWCQKCPGLAMLEHGDPLAPSSTNCRMATARMLAAGLLSRGETRESIADQLGVDRDFGRLPATDPVLAPEETSRGTGFSPRQAALESLGCGGCGTCGSSGGCASNELGVSFELQGNLELQRGTQRTAAAIGAFYELLPVFELERIPRPDGVPAAPR